MNRLISILLVLVSSFVVSQAQNKLDFKKALKNERVMTLSQIADSINYVKLETSDNCLVKSGAVIVTSKLILIKISKPAQIFVFDHSGKYLYNIGKQGQGPGEYGALANWDVSPDENYLAVQDFFTFGTHIFRLDGQYVKKIKSTVTMYDALGFADNETLVRFTSQNGMNGGRFLFEKVSLPSGEIEEFIWHANDTEMQKPGEIGLPPQISIDENGIFYSLVLNDTLFMLNKHNKKTPMLIYDLGKKEWPRMNLTREEMEKYHHPIGLTTLPNYFFMTLRANKADSRTIVIDRSGDELYALKPIQGCLYREGSFPIGLVNDLDGIQPYSVSPATFGFCRASLLQIPSLMDYREKECWLDQDLKSSQYRDELFSILERCDIEDNPIVRIVYLKH